METWICQQCTYRNAGTGRICAMCSGVREHVEQSTGGHWTCKHCTLRNDSGSVACVACNLPHEDYGDLNQQQLAKPAQTFPATAITGLPAGPPTVAEQASVITVDALARLRTVLVQYISQLSTPVPRPLPTYALSCWCDHVSQAVSAGSHWTCGYRNIQMLCGALMRVPQYRAVLFGGCGFVPDVPSIAAGIERAWALGFDREGAEQLGGRLVGRSVWIGSSECAALLRSFGIPAQPVAFHTLDDDTVPMLANADTAAYVSSLRQAVEGRLLAATGRSAQDVLRGPGRSQAATGKGAQGGKGKRKRQGGVAESLRAYLVGQKLLPESWVAQSPGTGSSHATGQASDDGDLQQAIRASLQYTDGAIGRPAREDEDSALQAAIQASLSVGSGPGGSARPTAAESHAIGAGGGQGQDSAALDTADDVVILDHSIQDVMIEDGQDGESHGARGGHAGAVHGASAVRRADNADAVVIDDDNGDDDVVMVVDGPSGAGSSARPGAGAASVAGQRTGQGAAAGLDEQAARSVHASNVYGEGVDEDANFDTGDDDDDDNDDEVYSVEGGHAGPGAVSRAERQVAASPGRQGTSSGSSAAGAVGSAAPTRTFKAWGRAVPASNAAERSFLSARHSALLGWLTRHFRVDMRHGGGLAGQDGASSSSSASTTAAALSSAPFPVYFQHQGHSRTLVGYEARLVQDKEGPSGASGASGKGAKGRRVEAEASGAMSSTPVSRSSLANGHVEVSLLMHDPSATPTAIRNAVGPTVGHNPSGSSATWPRVFKRGLHTLRHPVYEAVYVARGAPVQLDNGAVLVRSDGQAVFTPHGTLNSTSSGSHSPASARLPVGAASLRVLDQVHVWPAELEG